MSARQVLDTVQGAIQDAETGLAAKLAALKTAGLAPDDVRTDLAFIAWSLATRMQPATQPTVAVAIRNWQAPQRLASAPIRESRYAVEVGYEIVANDPAVIEANVTAAATALAQVIDGLREYSDAHGGTIVDVEDPSTWTFGEFDAGGAAPTSYGYQCTITLIEMSGQ